MQDVLYAHEVLVMFADYSDTETEGMTPSDANAGATGNATGTTPTPLSDMVTNP